MCHAHYTGLGTGHVEVHNLSLPSLGCRDTLHLHRYHGWSRMDPSNQLNTHKKNKNKTNTVKKVSAQNVQSELTPFDGSVLSRFRLAAMNYSKHVQLFFRLSILGIWKYKKVTLLALEEIPKAESSQKNKGRRDHQNKVAGRANLKTNHNIPNIGIPKWLLFSSNSADVPTAQTCT